jgi:hypothetical protein
MTKAVKPTLQKGRNTNQKDHPMPESPEVSFTDLLAMLTNAFPCEFRVAPGGTEIELFLNHGSAKSIVLKKDGTWKYK